MAKRNSNKAIEAVQPPQIPPDKGIVLVERQIEAGAKINAGSFIQDDDYRSWENTTENYLVKAFGMNHSNVEQFRELGRVWAVPFDAGVEFWQKHYRNSLNSQPGQTAGICRAVKNRVGALFASNIRKHGDSFSKSTVEKSFRRSRPQ